MVIDTCELAVDRGFMAVDGLGLKQVFAHMVYEWLGGPHRLDYL